MRVTRRCDAALIAVRAAAGTNARAQRDELTAEERLDVGHFRHRTYDAGAARVARERGETDRVFARAAGEAEFVEVFGGDTGQNSDREHSRRRDAEFGCALLGGFDGRGHHLRTAESVHGQERDPGPDQSVDAGVDSARNIVQFDVEHVRRAS